MRSPTPPFVLYSVNIVTAVDPPPYQQPLAPIQIMMLRDSFAEPNAGHHVEQLEITFSHPFDRATVAAAWRATVASCEVLRTAFAESGQGQLDQRRMAFIPEMEVHSTSPSWLESWLEADRLRPLLGPMDVPWRTAFWPDSRRWLWTFHHALLDGRSITRVLQVFLLHLENKSCGNLALSAWQPPSAKALAIASNSFQHIHRDCPTPWWPADLPSAQAPAVHHLGGETLKALESQAAALKVTAASVVIWAWGQALADFLGTDAVLVEQIRAGAPQPRSAGFTMNVLPLMIRRTSAATLPEFRAELLAMRSYETVSPTDFAADLYPDTAAAPVIMVEQSTMAHALGDHPLLESVTLHERPSDFPTATAYLRPDLMLKVEGPHRHDLLARWCAVVESPDFCIAGNRSTAGRVRR